ncbi:Cytochrome B pre-mRNA-processing protein 1 [Wickerhamomyces ciferrii]|uniref:Cytochrome B pre-mRNA-processing protein 1 n=1 Tax=Wickerhamomyces ciferrii (strain ATCC 14091 / BCRC 22168 / CBS 111 / JCM 3599 / NBRC 0793 / NRRL Y-1031 F-60-10) TaxID=1206466 RepID=K0KJN5_WICCF|nr:Cytochrome B pre-mRNA-processing protein 1 [Wickerhamomyces ciferrii]CCH43176.1 Cytochrome B pre-mRNA-processing protein 1 [Wickerhamomyces ciferrii]
MFNIIRPVIKTSKNLVIPNVRTRCLIRMLSDGARPSDQGVVSAVDDYQVQLNNILNGPCSTKKLLKTINQFYIPHQFSILDLAIQKGHHKGIINNLIRDFFHSSSAREFLILEMAKNSHIDLQRTRKILLKLYQSRGGKQSELWYPTIGPLDYHRFLMKDETNVIITIINIALNNNLTSMAFHTFMDHKERFEKNSIFQQEVLNSLILKNPLQDEYQLKNILEFQNHFNTKFNQFQANQIMSKISTPTTTPLFFKTISQLVIDNSPLTMESYINTIYDLISREVYNNNPESCAENWLKIKGYYSNIAQHDLNILASLISIFTKNLKYRPLVEEIILQLPSDLYGDPILVVPLLEFATEKRRSDLANEICLKIQPPISRRLLSSLLKLHIVFDDTVGTERIFQEINKSGEPLTKGDYHAIVSKLLRKDEFLRALSIVQSIPINISESSYVALINYIVDDSLKNKLEISDKNLAIIDTLLNKMEQFNPKNHGFWERISGLYIKYLAHSKNIENLQIAKQIYLNSTSDPLVKKYLSTNYQNSKAHIPGLEITYNPFSIIQKPEKIILKISNSSQVIILKTIADGAIKLKDKNSLNFALGYLTKLGFTKQDLINDFSRKYSKTISNMGFSITKNQRNRNIENHQLNFMKNRKFLAPVDKQKKLK